MMIKINFSKFLLLFHYFDEHLNKLHNCGDVNFISGGAYLSIKLSINDNLTHEKAAQVDSTCLCWNRGLQPTAGCENYLFLSIFPQIKLAPTDCC